jgi:hypothetical protein
MSQQSTLNRLTAADRCDYCSAQAYVRVIMANGHDLLFCAHDFVAADKDAKLTRLAKAIQDERDKIPATR